MNNPDYNRQDAEHLHTRRVGDWPLALPQQPQAAENVAQIGAEIDQLVERVRRLMRREPTLEHEMQA